MESFERARRPEGRPPAWRSSEGRMWERSPQTQKDGKDHLTGYEPGEQEKRPREVARMGGSYGDVSVGVSDKKELTLVVSKRRSREGPAALQDEKTLRGESARKMNLSRGEFSTNVHDPKKSAVAYRESHKKTPYFMLERFKEMMRTHSQETLDEQVPFLNRREDREELRRLEHAREEILARRNGDRTALRAIERRKQALRQALAEKEGQERRLRLLLQKAQEESRRRAGEVEQVNRPPAVSLDGEEPPPEDGKPGRGAAEALADALLDAALRERKEQAEAGAEAEEEKI